jgi:hypothetical protein
MKLTKTKLNENLPFAVKESAILNFIIGGIFLLLSFLCLFVDPIEIRFHSIYFEKSVIVVLIPGIFFTVKGFLSRTIFSIDKTGIYEYANLVTTWDHFIDAYYTQKEITGSYSDNFILIIHYLNPDDGEYHERTIPLDSTQTKSEEEIIDAINFYSALHKKELA